MLKVSKLKYELHLSLLLASKVYEINETDLLSLFLRSSDTSSFLLEIDNPVGSLKKAHFKPSPKLTTVCSL